MRNQVLKFLIVLIAGLALIQLAGCKDDPASPPVTVEEVPKNLFPLVPGRVIEYGQGYLTFEDSDSMIAGTQTGFRSSWLITPITPQMHPTLPVRVVLDSTWVPAAGVVASRQFFIAQDTATGNFAFLTNLGYFFRSRAVDRTDSLKWIDLAKASEGFNKRWIAFSEVFTSAAVGQIRLEIEAIFDAKETRTYGGQAYEAYRLVATRKAYLGTSTTPASIGTTARIWLVPGVGPVEIFLAGDAEAHGKSMTMTGKNF
jgi:hypothetical protein